MRIFRATMATILLSSVLTACSNQLNLPNLFNPKPNKIEELPTATHEELSSSRAAIGGSIAISMDRFDQIKMNRALDGGVGKATTWVSSGNGTTYSVTPVKKVMVENNSFCREYTITAVKGSQNRSFQGTACVSSDGNWHEVTP